MAGAGEVTSSLQSRYRAIAAFGTAWSIFAVGLLLVLPIGAIRVMAILPALFAIATLRFQFLTVSTRGGAARVVGLLRTRTFPLEGLAGWGVGSERASLMLSLSLGHARRVEPVFLVTTDGQVIHVEVLDIDVHGDESTPLGTVAAATVFGEQRLKRVDLP